MIKVKDIEVRPSGGKARKARVYIHPEGETIMQNLLNRHSRPRDAYRKEVLPKVVAKLGLPENTKFRWSQYAGCSCPCSPGFICEDESLNYQTVYVDVTEE